MSALQRAEQWEATIEEAERQNRITASEITSDATWMGVDNPMLNIRRRELARSREKIEQMKKARDLARDTDGKTIIRGDEVLTEQDYELENCKRVIDAKINTACRKLDDAHLEEYLQYIVDTMPDDVVADVLGTMNYIREREL